MFCREILANVAEECLRKAKERNVVILTAAQPKIPFRGYQPRTSVPPGAMEVVTIDYMDLLHPTTNPVL